jgi:hypothetical protein
MSLAAPLLTLLLVRLVLGREGRLRGSGRPRRKVLLGLLTRAGLVFAAVNTTVFVKVREAALPGTEVRGWSTLLLPALAGTVVLAAIALWDRLPKPPTLEEVRAATRDADRALRRVRAENERVRRQSAQVQERVAVLRGHREQPRRQGGGYRAEQGRSEVDFHSLCTFHRDSYQCADTAHVAYRSSQDSLHTMESIVRRMWVGPQHWVAVGRQAKLAKAELRAAAVRMSGSQSELQALVQHGLGMVRELNAGTAELKHEIRDSCGERGRQWYAALEERIEEARALRY